MDTTKADPENVVRWRETAKMIHNQYNIVAYPTFLFFSPDGKIVHREQGYKAAASFMALANTAMNSKSQYYTFLENYRVGKKDYSMMPDMANEALKMKEKSLASEIAQDYITHVLLPLKDDSLYTPQHIQFMSKYLSSKNSKVFQVFYKHPEKIDAAMHRPGYAKSTIDYVITGEEIAPKLETALKENNEPDWSSIAEKVQKKYTPDYAERNIIKAKVRWYRYHTDKFKTHWPEYIQYAIMDIDKYGSDTTNFLQEGNLNNIAWDTFLHSNDKTQIRTVTKWMQSLVRRSGYKDVYFMDTYANLLYKAGQTAEALAIEEKVAAIAPQSKLYIATLDKMKTGQPTWPVQ
ncbi:hypothetical protein FGG08_007026 [Glutinoglossum americanum]|uniref:Uncharacterized protein n=1 Tax=Glutinoglossum americanum TaxID=1670608 RepID=A0A9P8HX47_9PEZI|nr:hypothetical protein FGG08_007026 [Glutinoglossum americanum]